MGYDSTTGVISLPIKFADINAALGTSYGTLRELCTADAVEAQGKWSKIKPVSRAANGPLQADNIKSSRVTEGYVWGLKCAATDYSKLHECTWAYTDKPTGDIGTSPYRLQDFNGFKKGAAPTLQGTSDIGSEVVYGGETPFSCVLDWTNYSGNTYGVDPTTALTGFDKSNLYLCVAVDGYCTAMLNGRANDTVTPIYSTSTSGSYGREYTCPQLPTDLQKAATSRNISFFLTNDITDINGAWKDLAGTARARAVTVPGLAGFTAKFVSTPSVTSYGKWTMGDLVQFGLNTAAGFQLSLNCTTAPTAASNYQVVLQIGNGQAATKTFTMSANSTLVPMVSWAFSSKELPFVAPSVTTTYTWKATLYGVNSAGVKTTLASNKGSVTYSV